MINLTINEQAGITFYKERITALQMNIRRNERYFSRSMQHAIFRDEKAIAKWRIALVNYLTIILRKRINPRPS
ncbi:hypothetical protein KFE96_04995 [Kordiimonas sp. SCSIO 12603]|uniref:hypothetical protein n=1 Tax=Kordiimonas sp. SCSIO 12603 TaxID=2829596 RepID=UPI0021028A72|nr:hypothetical protein [Kordiimonas sp. SCSIO 12603]UTW59663.1 hypothetical protein KFE96_04995 [Kordiimonas sp. SCSIO 12603]